MDNTRNIFLRFLFVCFAWHSNTSAYPGAAYICCVPNQWQALAYVDLGTVFIDENTAFSYINGTATIAYSYTKQKVFVNLTGVEQSPLIPLPAAYDMVILYDFGVGTSYQIFAGECTKVELPKAMTKQCIPDDANFIKTGNVDGRHLSTYRFTSGSDTPFQITATVFKHDDQPISPELCDPVDVVYYTPSANPDSGTLTRLSFTDLGAVKDEGVFQVPKECL